MDDRTPDDPLRMDIINVLLDHKEDYSLWQMEKALQSEAQAVRQMSSTTPEQEESA